MEASSSAVDSGGGDNDGSSVSRVPKPTAATPKLPSDYPKNSPRIISASDESGLICDYDSPTSEPKIKTRGFFRQILDVFLPAGYPHTVTPDYTPYQVFDSLQAFSSTIAGLLSSRAVLQGFGVGDAASSATGAVLLTVLQESTGRLGTILFAHRLGRAIEPECKFYRFLADIFNDTAMFLDVLSPALPHKLKVTALCASGVLRALCGVSGMSAKASLSAHFARSGNLAELNAKDGSQETVISLMGMLAGSVFVRYIEGRRAVYGWTAGLIGMHLWTNYKAVCAVQMRTLSRQRLYLVLRSFNELGVIRDPYEVCCIENILFCKLPPIKFATSPPRSGVEFATKMKNGMVWDEDEAVLVGGKGKRITIYMKEGATSRDVIMAWVKAVEKHGSLKNELNFDKEIPKLQQVGWDIDTNALETGPAIRIKTANF
ncbi:vitamin B6 photo-protection and homoeostasis-domain-containing protein [Xylariaceae sp. FL0255]|nr:vitamin B6 photo-protection and homoeostasis-domain-containing protein [Xylariaceae sp. FL0255]